MRGEGREGRFSINHERQSVISGTTKEIVNTVGNKVDWWFYDPINTVVDDIYDVGGNDTGGRRFLGPISILVANSTINQGVTVQSDRGFYNTDVLSLTINIDLVEDHRNTYGKNAATYPNLTKMETNPDKYLRDRVVFRNEVWVPTRILPMGLITDRFTVMHVDCNQVNPEELVNDPQFQHYANYNPFDPATV
jgi:hypothetical protein